VIVGVTGRVAVSVGVNVAVGVKTSVASWNIQGSDSRAGPAPAGGAHLRCIARAGRGCRADGTEDQGENNQGVEENAYLLERIRRATLHCNTSAWVVACDYSMK